MPEIILLQLLSQGPERDPMSPLACLHVAEGEARRSPQASPRGARRAGIGALLTLRKSPASFLEAFHYQLEREA